MLNFDEFVKSVSEEVQNRCPDVNVTIHKVPKENVVLTGISLKKENEMMSPAIYLDGYYDAYKTDGENVSHIVGDIIETYNNLKYPAHFDTDILHNFEEAKNYIIPSLVNRDRNQNLLSKIAHKEFLDLEIVYRFQVTKKMVGIDDTNEVVGSVKITKELLEYWNVTIDELHEVALKNINFHGCSVTRIAETIKRFYINEGMPEEMAEIGVEPIKELPLHVCTNDYAQHGAILAFLNPFICKKISKMYDTDLILLPSSIHETIIAPADIMPVSDMKEMVQCVNSTNLRPEEFLSDSVYYYDKATGDITIAE